MRTSFRSSNFTHSFSFNNSTLFGMVTYKDELPEIRNRNSTFCTWITISAWAQARRRWSTGTTLMSSIYGGLILFSPIRIGGRTKPMMLLRTISIIDSLKHTGIYYIPIPVHSNASKSYSFGNLHSLKKRILCFFPCIAANEMFCSREFN